jgi:phage/plasmid-associated DNA primase
MDLEGWREMIPKILGFLERLFPGDELNKVLEMLGALVIPSYVRKIWLIVGPPGVGKSVFKELLLKIFEPASSSFSLDWIAESEFNYPLLGKLVNISSEGARSLINARGVERLKRYSGEETITFEEKYHPAINGRNIIKMVFLLNEYPQFEYLDEAFLDRLYIIETTEEKVKEPKPEPQILRELLGEKDAFAAFILWCMRRLLKEGFLQFKHDRELEEKKELFAYALNPVAQWIQEECVREGRTERKTLYAAYLKWAQEKAKPIIPNKQFYSMLRTLGYLDKKIKGECYFTNLSLKAEQHKTPIGSFLKHTACEKCGATGAYMITREDGTHYLCPKCLENWPGNL